MDQMNQPTGATNTRREGTNGIAAPAPTALVQPVAVVVVVVVVVTDDDVDAVLPMEPPRRRRQ